jgi:hypothetical protein
VNRIKIVMRSIRGFSSTLTLPLSLTEGEGIRVGTCSIHASHHVAQIMLHLFSTDWRQVCKRSDGATDFIGALHFNFRGRRRVRGTITDIESHCLPHSATARRINRHCSCWLQQTPAHSRNRIRERRYLSLFRRSICGTSRADVGGVKSAVLRFQYQTTLSVDSDPIAAKGTSAGEITRLRPRPRRARPRIEAEISAHSWSKRTGVSNSLK